MIALALNAGSSSLKFAGFEGEVLRCRWRGRIDLPRAELVLDGVAQPQALDAARPVPLPEACRIVFDHLADAGLQTPTLVVHRVVHGGERFHAAQRIDDQVVVALEALNPLAPMHQPASLAAVRASRSRWPQSVHIACFDTAFHARWPDAARRFALPRALHDAGVRRYGFHGLAHRHAAEVLRLACPQARRAVVAHLGSGASLCALSEFASVDCSMGFSTLDGLPMATRCGALDPGVVPHLQRSRGLGLDAIEALLYRESGLLGVSGISADLRVLLGSPRPEAAQAVEMFVHHLVRGIGAMAATLGGLDAIAFSGGIGEHSPQIRASVCARLAFLGVQLDPEANAQNLACLEAPAARVAVRVVRCDEEAVMARDAVALIAPDRDV